MIIGRKISYDKDLDTIYKLLKESNIIDNITREDIIYVLEVNKEIVGVCKISFTESIGILKYLIIRKCNRGENLGDGLLRAIFNYCLRIGITTIQYPCMNEYLLKKGFNIIHNRNEENNIKNISKYNNLLECNLNTFFDKPCGCKRGCSIEK